jgi:hypothetical protein
VRREGGGHALVKGVGLGRGMCHNRWGMRGEEGGTTPGEKKKTVGLSMLVKAGE